MKITKAHIINFGKFCNQDFDFQEGLTTFIYENGWGKTTLTNFIKAMLYGMDATSSTKIERNERAKYAPWQGGTFGGYLEFSHNGKNYRVTRTFETKGKTDKNDTFELRDLGTNKVSLDFSKDLGCEIFGINRETYSRSAHVILSESPLASSDISAKLNNLIESGDAANFDKAASSLDEKIKSLSRAKSGEIAVTKEKISQQKNELCEIDSLEKQTQEISGMMATSKAQKAELQKEFTQYEKQTTQVLNYQKKLNYESLKSDLENAQNSKTQILDFFNGNLPNAESVKKIESILSEYKNAVSNLQNQGTSPQEKSNFQELKEAFQGDIPQSSQIQECLKLYTDYQNYKAEENGKKLSQTEQNQYEGLKQKFSGKNISADSLNQKFSEYTDLETKNKEISELQGKVNLKETELLTQKQIVRKNPKKTPLLISFAITFIAAAFLGALVITKIIPFMCVIAAGIVGLASIALLIAGLALKNIPNDTTQLENELAQQKQNLQEAQNKAQNLQNGLTNFIRGFGYNENNIAFSLSQINEEFVIYSRLENQAQAFIDWEKSQKLKKTDYENELQIFAKRFLKKDDISSISQDIHILDEKLKKFDELAKKINFDSENEKIKNEKSEKLKEILSQFKTDKIEDFDFQVQQIRTNLTSLDNIEKTISQAQSKIQAFENNPENDISVLQNLTKPEFSVNELEQKKSSIAQKMNELEKTIQNYQSRINFNLAKTETRSDVEVDLKNLQQEQAELENKNALFSKTLELLSRAKENLDANYSKPMQENFRKYLGLIGSKLNLQIDTDLKVNVDNEGILHESIFLSEGYKDLVNFCTRMALIDSLFGENFPPIVLDDPFVNLDDDKVQNGCDLVKNLSEEKQILYFACHKSRDIQ